MSSAGGLTGGFIQVKIIDLTTYRAFIKGADSMTDINGIIVIVEAVKNAKTDTRLEKIIADLLCVLCDNDCTVNEAFSALGRAQLAIHETRLIVAQYGNNPELEGSYAEGKG